MTRNGEKQNEGWLPGSDIWTAFAPFDGPGFGSQACASAHTNHQMLPRLAQRALRPSLGTLASKTYAPALSPSLCRTYALSRDPNRARSRVSRNPKSTLSPLPAVPQHLKPASQEIVEEAPLLLEGNPDSGGLEKLLANDTLVVVR